MSVMTQSVAWRWGAALAACALSATAWAADAPLLQEGKKSLYQRVLTTPGCMLAPEPGHAKPVAQPAFSRFYVYARKQVQGADWLQVGPDSFGKRAGWLPAACTVDWKMQLTLAFTNPANRDPLLFFKERPALEAVLDASDPVSKVAPLRAQLKKSGQAPGVQAQEPAYFVDVQQQFYLLPVLQGEEVMTESGFRTRVLQVASVSKADPASTAAAGAGTAAGAAAPAQPGAAAGATPAAAASQLTPFRAAIVFVIDSTISMDPYIDRTKEAIRKVYQQIDAQKLGDQVSFGLVSFRSSTKAVPGLEYVTRIYADPNEVKDSADFFRRIADLKQARVSSREFDEDAYAGVLQAVGDINWNAFGARYVVLITDAGALDGDNPLSLTGLGADQVRLEAANPGVAIYTLHLKTPAGSKNHARAEAQYRNLSTYGGTNTSLYYPVDAGDVDAFGQKVDTLAAAIAGQVKAAYLGDAAIGSAINAKPEAPASAPAADPAQDKLMADTALIGHAMRLAYLGQQTGTQAPPVFDAWISDRDLIHQNLPTTDVRVLLTKAQLSDLSDVVKKILDAANTGLISPADMFASLRAVAATMGADPNQLKQEGNAKLASLGVLGEYLEDLPYQSAVLELDEDTWKSWDGLAQEKFIRTLGTKLRHYQRYNADADRWVSLAPDSDARDNVYPVPLEMMP